MAKSEGEAQSDKEIKSEDDNEKSNKKKKKKKSKEPKKDKEFGVSRGIDFQDVKTVLNFAFPTSTKSYVHRIGRTARGHAKGLAISLVAPEEEELLQKVEEKRSLKIKDFGLQMKALDPFRYRCEDVLSDISKRKVMRARSEVLRREILASQKLKRHFKQHGSNERDLLRAVHMKEALPMARSSDRMALRTLPNYLLSNELESVRNPSVAPKRKRVKFSKKSLPRDPVLGSKVTKKRKLLL